MKIADLSILYFLATSDSITEALQRTKMPMNFINFTIHKLKFVKLNSQVGVQSTKPNVGNMRIRPWFVFNKMTDLKYGVLVLVQIAQ